MATWNSDGSLANVQALINQAQTVDGDIITIPSGAFTWSSTLTVTKAITLQGNSTTNPHAPGCNLPFQGDPPPNTHVDNTQIMYNVPSKLIDFRATTGNVQRITGVSIMRVNDNQTSSVFEINGFPSTPLRVDHCFIDRINVVANIIWCNSYNYGVFDHNVTVCEHGVIQNGPGRFNGDQGDSAFEEPVAFGGPKFFFVEDNWLKHGGDIVWGGKSCFRYNHLHGETTLGPPAPGTVVGAVLVCHGTGRQGSGRGGRAYEVYGNDFHWNDSNKTMDGSDTGSAIWWGNTFDNNHKTMGGGDGNIIDIACYRMGLDWQSPYFTVNGLPGQTWDLMDTEGNGTNVPGHSTFVYASGVITAGSNGQITFPGTPNWTTNQWQGYVARRASGQSAGITGNNANTLFLYNVGFGTGWAAGQTAEIVRPIHYLDQCGSGWGDHINRASPAWPNMGGARKEPLYSWNNINADNGTQHINFSNAPYLLLTSIQGVDYFQDTPMPGYTPYTYPHPLVGGGGPPPPPSGPLFTSTNFFLG